MTFANALARRLLFAPLLIGGLSVSLQAQEPRQTPAGFSDLASENLGKVSASASQIQAILQQQPGLFVELKRGVAREAAANGQVIKEADLADQKILARLESDAQFRAVATRLLERYGYLVPRFNPDSEAAEERKLILQTRANQLATQQNQQVESQMRQATGRNYEQTAVCDPKEQSPDVACPPSAPAETAKPDRSVPRNQSQPSRTIQAQNQNPDHDEDDALVSPAIPLGGQILTAGMSSSQNRSLASDVANKLGVNPGSFPAPANPGSASDGMENESANRSSESAEIVPNVGKDAPRERRNPRLVRTRNPYSDIPSLYDMYQQGAPRAPELARFGSDVFHENSRPPRNGDSLPMDLPVGPDYVLGPGDGVTINLWGTTSRRLFRTVDPEGRLSLPEAGPVLVSGRTLGQVQEAVQQLLRTQFRDISADVSLSRLRTIRVYVVGDVQRPGAYDISSLSTPLNALFTAGGPTAAGSSRIARQFRGKQLVQEVDLYDLLLHGVRSDMEKLQSGDTVLVPPLDGEVTIEGMVRRPAVYELHGEKSLADALQLSGGVLPTATLTHIEVQRLVAHEKHTMLSLDLPESGDEMAEAVKKLGEFAIQPGDTVHVFPIAPFNKDAVYLEGHVLRPGKFSYHDGMKLTDLVSSYSDLLPEPATKYAEIIRLNPPDYHPVVEGFDLAAALANPQGAPKLEPLEQVAHALLMTNEFLFVD